VDGTGTRLGRLGVLLIRRGEVERVLVDEVSKRFARSRTVGPRERSTLIRRGEAILRSGLVSGEVSAVEARDRWSKCEVRNVVAVVCGENGGRGIVVVCVDDGC
jgi:hypothetical protein